MATTSLVRVLPRPAALKIFELLIQGLYFEGPIVVVPVYGSRPKQGGNGVRLCFVNISIKILWTHLLDLTLYPSFYAGTNYFALHALPHDEFYLWVFQWSVRSCNLASQEAAVKETPNFSHFDAGVTAPCAARCMVTQYCFCHNLTAFIFESFLNQALVCAVCSNSMHHCVWCNR